jgi:hypothetical protein
MLKQNLKEYEGIGEGGEIIRPHDTAKPFF